MASHHKKESEGIALLSIYGDEEEDDEEMAEIQAEAEDQQFQPIVQLEQEQELMMIDENPSSIIIQEDTSFSTTIVGLDLVGGEGTNAPQQQRVSNDNFSPSRVAGVATPRQDSLSSPALPPLPRQQLAAELRHRRKERVAIVDYGHDEVAMSPEPEEGEIMVSRNVMEVDDDALINGDFQEKTVPLLTPSDQGTSPQLSDPNDQAETDTRKHAVVGSESAEAEDADMVPSKEPKDVDLLNKFLPQPPEANCLDELQEKISKFLRLKKIKSYNAEVRNRKEYRNPDFLRHAMIYHEIDEIGSCFSKDVFDPHGYSKSDFYDEIETDMRREMERKEQERKRSPKIDFLSAGTQPGPLPTSKISLPIPVSSGTGFNTITAAAETLAREGRQNKKSKWDKVDGDKLNLLPTVAQDCLSAGATHAALSSTANAGGGYSAYAQQRRWQAEDKRSSDKKSDRRT